MQGGIAIWTGVLLLAATGLEASAGPTPYSGPLPHLATAVADHDPPDPASGFAAAAWSAAGWPGPALDLAAAGKLSRLPARACEPAAADARLHLATAAGSR